MSDNNTSYFDLYKALKADGAVQGDWGSFHKFIGAPGKQGYLNRKKLYDALKADGAVQSGSYEEFNMKLFRGGQASLKAARQRSAQPRQGESAAKGQQQQRQAAQPQTAAQMALSMGGQQKQQTQPRTQQPTSATPSSTDYMKNWQLMHKRNDQMTPVEQMQTNTMRSRMQQAQKQASQQEQHRANPISQSRITPTAQNFNETMQQLSSSQAKRARAVQQREDDARNLAQYEVEGNQFSHNDGKHGTIAPEIDSLVAPSMKEADDLSWTQYQQDLKNAGNDAFLRNKAWKDLQDNRIKNRQNVLANNLSAKLQEIYSQKGLQEHIIESADKLNMGVEEYVDQYVTPQMMQRAQNILGVKNIEEILPQSATEYVVRRLSDSILGTLSAGQDKSREQIAREQEAMAISDGLEEMPTVKDYKANEGYKSGVGARFASTAANMAMDSPILGMTGGAANMSVDLGKQVLMRGLAKAGLVKMGAKLTAQQLAFKAANMTMAQKIASGLVEGSAKGALNLGGYSSITAALGQASTGDDTSLSALGKAALEGFEHGATTGAMFGVSGAIMAPWVSKFGINGLETSTGEKWLHGAQKLGATGVGLGVEAGTMMVADNITGDKDISVGTWLEDLVMVGAFKAGEPKNYAHIGSALYGLVHNTNNTFRVGKDQNGKWRTVDIHMTKDEQNELMNSVSGKNLVEAFQKVDKSSLNSKTPLDKSITKQAYQDFMNDPNVSQSTKEKVNAAMGLFNTTSAKSYRSVNDVQNKQILEYSKNGTLLTRTSYKNADERRAILYKQKLYRDNEEMRSLAGYSKLKDLQPTDENGEVTRLAFAFLTDKGYNPNETVTESNNARLIAGLRDKNSDLYKEWEKYVDRFGSLGMLISDTTTWKNGLLEVFIGDREINLDTIMLKDPMKRTDEENKIFYQVKNALESELFPNGKPHVEQSETQGHSVADNNNLGTELPNGEAVKQELNGLRQAEAEMDVLMRDNDVFSQNFKKLQSQGLTNPQIYDWMIQNGLTQEQLEPFAHYINANARVQGMQEATKQKIEEVVSGVVQDWSYHGELNGQKMDGEQVVYVQDSEGRTLIVGSGDVAFDSTTGRAKEDVGDMLICLDPNTKEMVYLKKDEVTLFQTQRPEDFANEYRQRLQMINSQPYNEAAQEQAMQDAANSKNEVASPENQNQNSESNGSESTGLEGRTQNIPKGETSSGNQEVKADQAPGTNEQSQQTRKFADGTDVPMTTDSKGRPTPDYGAMKPEQAAEILSQDFGENAEKVVDGQIKKAEKALKDAEKMKVDYTAEPNDILEQEQVKAKTIEAAKKQLEQAQNIKKAMTAKAVAETMGKPTEEKVEGANEASSEVAKKFQNAPRLQGNHVSKRLPNGDKISGHYEIVPAESLTPSHDAMNDYKKSEGFPVDAEGRTINDRDYEHDKAAQQTTDQMAHKYSGQAITQVPTVSDEGIVYDGNGRTMAGQKAAKNGTDGEYIEDLMDNAQNYGFTKEQIEQSGIEHPRLVMVTDERLPYDTATFSMFNRNEKKTQSNTEQAVAKAKTLTSDEVGAIVADIEGNGSLDAFFNNSKAINDLVKTLVSKGVIGQNEVAGFLDGPDRLSAQGKEYVKNLLLGSVFKPETIRMLGVDSKIKNAAINGIRAIMDNLKLGDYSLRDEIDQAIQLLYEARRNKMSVDDLLKQSSAFEENARDRFPMMAQAMAQALEGKASTFRELMSEYNNIAKNYNTNEGALSFYEMLTPEQLVAEFLKGSKAIKENNIKLYGNETGRITEKEGGNDVAGNEKLAEEAGGGSESGVRGLREADEDKPNSVGFTPKQIREHQASVDEKREAYIKALQDGKSNKEVEDAATKYEFAFKDHQNMMGIMDEASVEDLWKKELEKAKDSVPMPLLPKEEKPDLKFNPIEAAAEDYKKEHPLSEDEILNTTAFDDLSEDQKQYCIDAALDYLNGEDTSAIAEAYYRNAYEKRANRPAETEKVAKADSETVKAGQAEVSSDPMEGIKNAAEGFEQEKAERERKQKEATQKVLNVIKASNEKAKTRKQLEAEKNAADNEFEAFMKDLRKKRSGQLNSGFIDQNLIEAAPKMFSLAAKCAYTRIKLGMYDAKEVVKDLRNRFKDAFDGFDKRDVETFYSEIMNQKWRDGDKRMSLNEWAEHYRKLSPEYKEKLEGDSKEAEERKISEKKFIDRVNIRLGFGQKINGIVELRKMAEDCGLKDVKDTDLQELAETAIVKRARGIATSASTNDVKKFELIKKLYENQPSLNQRDSERVMRQQYSTPAPYAFLADMYVKGGGKEVKSALEPSAGNGMLTIGLPMDVVHVNDIDAQRLANLRRQGFKNVTSQDGTQPFADKDVDVVVTNPPFGSATPKEYDGYKISSLEGQMAINALESMKDDGRAAIIIGGKTEYAKNGSLNPKDKAFLGYLYSHYNVEDVINVDGSLYAKQGTTYPTRIILINGRRLDENAFPPVKSKARAETVKDYDELYKRINDDILRGERMETSIGGEKRSARPELDRQGSADTHEKGLRMGQSRGGERKTTDGLGGVSDETSVRVPDNGLGNGRGAEREPDGGLYNGNPRTDGAGAEPTQSEGRGDNFNGHGVGGSVHQPSGTGRTNVKHNADGSSSVLKPRSTQERSLSSEKVGYAPKSENPFTLQSVMPADQQKAVADNLAKLGDADQFLVDELGYNDKDDLYSHLAAEQVDSVALALQQAKKGNAFIIGDMTGIGKGRQAASLIRYAKKQGQVPVYFTKTAGLLSDVYRDLVDIGSPDLRPFVFGSSDEAKITDGDGKLVYKLPTDSEKERVLSYINKYGKLPKEYDYVLTTYSQVANGVYEFDENDNRKERKLKKGDTFGPSHFNGQARRDAIEKLISNGYLILDESHTAGGQSNQGNYFQHIIQKAKNVTFFSATFAKRPDNMPIYALRTAMNQGGLKASELIDAVNRGGATLQEIMSQTLTQCGQMIRRERDMTGVTIDWKPIDDPVVVSEQREQYDKTIELFNDIINFQKAYVMPYINERNEELAAIQASMGLKRGTKALGIASTPFASKAFNTVQQVLLSLKAKEAAKRAIDYLNQGIKPVIALNNTNESQSGEIKENVEVEEPDLGTSLKKGLAGTLRYTKKNAKNKEESGVIDISSLGDDAINAYNELMKKIENASTGLALSPIDVIKNELQKAGYKVGELTGRKTEFIYNDNGSVSKVKRANTDKKKLAREFNDGTLDALILNKSASTGISLHASSKFKDQRKRVMIVAQQQLDVNDEVQMRGRIDRTGQVTRGAYEYIVSQIPAEQRLLMMFKAKLKSLDANTTSSQKSKFNQMDVADITNKYGDKVVREYMAEHLDLYSRMADPFGWEKSYGEDLFSIDTQKLATTRVVGRSGNGEAGSDASKLLGRMALLKVAEQEKMLNEIGELYANEIQRLNEMGENDLEITELPLKAKTISKEVWKEGAEPGGDNAFADNTYIEKVNMAILKKPMKAEEVKKAQDGLTGGKSWDEYKEEKWKAIESYFVNKGAEEGAKIEERARKAAAKAREKYIKDAKRGQKDSGMTDEQIAQMAIYQQDNIYKQESAKSEDLIKNLKNKAGMFLRVLETFNTEDAYVLPVDMNKPNELSGFGNSYGRLIDIKITDNFSPNASTVSFATLDGRRKITFPISGMVGSGENRTDVIAAIDLMTRQASGLGDKHLRVLSMDVNNWDKLVSNESRKDGYIVTGNLMQALIDSKNQGVGGQLVKYTTETGEVKTGILMPDRFKPTDVANEYPISSVADKFELPSHKGGIEQAVSSDGDVKVILGFDHGDTYYQIQVPKSKAKGGKYFLDKDLLSMVRGHNFETRGNRMMANIDENQLRPVLARLSNLGVKVREERKSSDDGTHFREDHGLQYSKTDTKDVKKSRIIPEDVDKSVSSQIEKKFDDRVNELTKDLSEEDKAEFNRHLDHYTSDFSRARASEITYTLNGLRNELIFWERTFGNGERAGRTHLVQIRKVELEAAEAAARREMDYREVRAKALEDSYGLRRGAKTSFADISRLFEATNQSEDGGTRRLFEKASDIAKRLGVEFGGKDEGKTRGNIAEATPDRDINFFIDSVCRTNTNSKEIAHSILHEMIHQATMGAIHLVKDGKADGMLTPKQIEAVKNIIDIYNKAKADGRIVWEDGNRRDYGGKDEYEFAAEMSSEKQRNALDIPLGERIMNAVRELRNRGDNSLWQAVKNAWHKLFEVSDKSKMDKALNDIMDDFNKNIDDVAMNDIEENGYANQLDSPVSSHIAQLSEKVGAKVNMVNSADEVTNKQAKEAIEEGKHITGWYDEKTGEVHLYMPNIHDRYTAEKTIWHEVVGHKGMRELFGEDRFDKFLRSVWYDLDKPEYAVLKKLVMEEMKYNPFNVYNAIEEGIARLAEDGRGEAGFWNNIKNKVSDFLHEIGYRMAPNTKDVKYLLWLSKNLQKNPNDPYWKMRAEAVKYRLDHERVPSVIEHDGVFRDNDGKIYKDLGDLPKAEYQEATDGQIHFRTTPSAGTALDRYHRSLDEHGYMFTESYMDNMLSLKNLMTAIVPGKKIEDIASSENPYILQNTMQGAMSDAAQMFERNVMKPLDKAMAQVLDAFDGKKDDEKIRNFNLYMITKHGLERNRILYVRDALKDMRMDEKKKKLADTIENDWNNEKATLDEKLERGDIDLKEYYKQMDDFIRTYVDETNKFDAGEHDYSGIHAIQEVEKNSDPYDDAEAIQSVMDSEGRMEDIKKGAVKDYWDKVKTATQYAIDCDYRNGLISRELYGHVSAMFNWYVPLRKYDEATAEDTYGYITEKGDPKSYIGKTIMRARGHKYLSETNILAQIGAMGNRAIKNGGQNAIKQAFARFIRNNSNNNLVTETSVWYVSDPITQTTVERYPDIPDDATADEISQIVSDFNMEMKDLQSKGLATKVYRRGRIGYKFQRAENKSQHIVDVMIAGKKHSFIVNGNPRAAQALNGLLENSAAKGIMKPLGSISRMMAQLCTSYNPEFVMRNVMRDAEFASSNVTAKEGARYGGIWAKYYAQLGLYKGASNISLGDLSGSTGLGLFAKYRNGTLDMNDKIQRYFKEFMENGGETGWVQIKNMKEWEKQYKQDVKGERSKVQRGGKMVRDFFFGNLENLNEVAENIARFSTYCASREFGRSVVRSTYDAKEVSTNFNRHGSGDAIKSFKNGEMTGTKAAARWAYGFTSSYLRHCSMFFNAGIQSTNLLVKNLKNHPVGTSVNMLSIPFALGALGALLNNALIASEDEKDRKGVKDPYGELPDYVRRNNLCIYKGGGEFITIPLAIELRAFYGLGDLAAGLTFSPNVSGQKNPYFDAVGCMSQLVPVMDYLGNSSSGRKPLEETIKAISPSAIAPFIEWEQNSDWKGAPIERRGDWNENVPAWQRAYNGTPEGLKTLNKFVNAQTNDVAKGNEDMLGNGFLDMVTNPSMVNHFFGGIGGGAATFAERTLGTIKHGSDTETKDIPFVRSLLYTPSEQSSLQRTKSKWYNYKDEMEVTMANVDRLKSKNVPIDKRLQNIGEYYQFQNSKDAAKVRIIDLAEKQMKQWKKLRDKSSDAESIKFANENIDRIMMEAVEQMDRLN